MTKADILSALAAFLDAEDVTGALQFTRDHAEEIAALPFEDYMELAGGVLNYLAMVAAMTTD